MSLKTKTLTPTFAAVWVCVAIFAIWQTNLRANDVASAIGAGLLLLTSIYSFCPVCKRPIDLS